VSLRYRSIVNIVGTLGVVTIMIVGYLWLMANVTKMNYEYAKATHERTRLLDQTSRLDDQIAHLESRERLAAIASKLGMTEPARFGVATLAPLEPIAESQASRQAVRGVALLRPITDWLR
jgi:cell division protein FtsL